MRLPSVLAIFLILLLLILASGCSTPVPIVPPFPNVPESLKKACPDLKPVNADTTKLSDVLTAVTDNYRQYYDCKSQVDDWIEWYTTQKGIFDKIK
jgi:hypothetical protein